MIRKTKNEQAYQGIKKLVISGEFTHDAQWSLRSLADKFGMSVAPVTEAVRRLEQEGLLLVKPQQGITVRQLSLPEIQEYTIIREGLEIQAVRLLSLKRSEKDAMELRGMVRELNQLVDENYFDDAAYQDFLLHREMVKKAEIHLLLEQFERISAILFLTTGGWNGPVFAGEAEFENDNHEQLIEIIFQGDPDRAEKAVRNHINSIASKAAISHKSNEHKV
ncbi:MAG: GntR family transcriptional regulator [Bacteroidetes bacterium]|nr:GntR family transcriptional regulator [Bacteroidota bacterium]